MRLVVDAGVAIKWLVAEENSDAADRLPAGGDDLHAPRLMTSEIAKALWRKFHVWAPLPFDRPRNRSTARSSRAMFSLSSPPIFRPSLHFATVVTLSAMVRDGKPSPFRSSGSSARRISGALVSSVVNGQIVIELVASKSSSCGIIEGYAWPV